MPHRRDPIDETEQLRRTLVHLETAQRIGRMGSWSGELAYDYELYFSSELRELLAYGADWPEPTFAQFLEMIHPDDRDRYLAMRDAAFAGEGPYEIDCRYVTLRGEEKHFHVAADIERDETGRPIRLIGIAQDITASVRLFEQLLETETARRETLRRLVRTADEERFRLAAAMHDGPIQELTAAALRLEHAATPGAPGSETQTATALETIRQVIGSLRSTLFELHPTVLGHRGMAATLEHLASTVVPQADVEVCVDTAVDLGDSCGTTVIRIAQEALLNVAKHAEADHVRLELSTIGGEVHLAVVDDGRGFDPEQPPAHGHFGLTAMRERAEGAGGELAVRSGPDGTTVSAWLPGP